MPQIIFLASINGVESLEIRDNPAQSYPCMSTLQIHHEARAQLYALVTGEFFDEAREMETLERALQDDGPFIYRLTDRLKESLARLEEDQVEQLCSFWVECEEIELLDIESNELHDFMFQLIHFCQTACNDNLEIFIYSDD